MAEFTAQTPTQAVVAKVIKDSAGNGIIKRSGYQYINGSLIPNAISETLARAIRAGRIVRPGTAISGRFLTSIDPRKVLSVTAQIQTNMGLRTRTLRSGSEEGTPGNSGLMNLKGKLIPSTTPFEIPIRQLDDQPLFFPQMQLETMLFDEVVETVGNYVDNNVNSQDSYHMAKAIAMAMYRGAKSVTDPSDLGAYPNIITVKETDVYNDTYMIRMLNALNAKLANGDKETQLMTFSGPRSLVARPELIGYLKTPKTGFVLNSDISTKMLYEPNFDIVEAVRYGSQYRGNISGGYDMEEAPSQIWNYVEKWLGLVEGDLDRVLGIVFTPVAYAEGGVAKKDFKQMQSSEYDGVVAFPFIKFGGTAYRMMYLITYDDWAIPLRLQNADHPVPVVAPYTWQEDEPIEKVIYDQSGNPIGVQEVAAVLKPNGDAESAVTVTVLGTADAKITNASVSVTVDGRGVPVLNNVNGEYIFSVKRGSVPSVMITATGYQTETFSLTKSDTKKSFVGITKTLTA